MRNLETSEYNLTHCMELVRADWVSKQLKAKAAFYMADYAASRAKYSSTNLLMGIADSYVEAFMRDYTNEFKTLRRAS